MSHPKELIQKIQCLIELDYPAETYQYQIETALPGTRMFPDISVRDQTGKTVCAVEIGYTRPEKLSTYRDRFKIPDVRWYDKQGNLHADVKELAVALTVHAEPASELYVYRLDDEIECLDCLEEWREDFTDEADIDLIDLEEEISFARDAVSTILVTDYAKVWIACFCDKCGLRWFDIDSLDADEIIDDLRNYGDRREFARIYGRRSEPMRWQQCVELVQNHLGLELRYEDGLFINPQHNHEWNNCLLRVRQTALREGNKPKVAPETILEGG